LKVKKYRASSMLEAMKLIRSELGNDAIILNSRVIHTSGFLGFFKKRSIEVVAALDTKSTEPFHSVIMKEKQKPFDNPTSNLDSLNNITTNQKNVVEAVELRKELIELKSLLKNVKVDSKNSGIPLPKPIQQLKQLLTRQGINQKMLDEVIKMSLERWYMNGGQSSIEDVNQWANSYLIEQI